MNDDHDEIDDAKVVAQISDDEELIKTLGKWESQSKQHWGSWRRDAVREYEFVSGKQWSEADKGILLDEGRVPVVFNRTDPMVSAVLGAEILNRQEVTYLPREIGDVRTNEIVNDAAQWVRDATDASDEESDAFLDCIITGIGWTETRMDYEEDPEGMIVIGRVTPLQMWSDPSATKRGLKDRRYHWRGRMMDRLDVKALTTDAKYAQVLNVGNDGGDGNMTESVSSSGDDYELGPDEGGTHDKDTRGRIWVRHFQWFDLVDAHKVFDPETGESSVMKKDEYKQLVMSSLENLVRPPQSVKIKTRQYSEAFMAGKVLLNKREIEGFTFHPLTGKRDEKAGTWYGLVRAMTDPQMWANKWFSQIMHVLNTSAKGGLLYEENAVVNERELKEEWARPDSAIKLKAGALANGRIEERKASNYPAGLDKLMQFSFDAMPQVSGINLEMMGLVGKDQPGVLEAHRKQAGYSILAQFFDALKLYRKRQGRTLLNFIQEYISDGRLIRITGDNGAEQYVPLIRDDKTLKYDIIVDDAPMSANQKQMVWNMVMQMMPMLKDAPLPGDVWADLIKYSPLPAALSSKIGQAISEADQQPPDPMEQRAMQIEQEKGMAEITATTAQAEADKAQAARDLAEAEQTQAETATGAFLPVQREAA